MSEPTFRARWRVHRPSDADIEIERFTGRIPRVQVRRGLFRWVLDVDAYDDIDDETFVAMLEDGYRRHAFEPLQRDLGTLARYLVGQLNYGPLPSDVMDALKRWQDVERDTQ